MPSDAAITSPSDSPVMTDGVTLALHLTASLNPPVLSAVNVIVPTVISALTVSERSVTKL